MCSNDCFLVLLAILFPPLPVWVKQGFCSADSVINICLFLLGYVPGLLHAWYIIYAYPDPLDRRGRHLRHGYLSVPSASDDVERDAGTVTYYAVGQHRQAPAGPQGLQQPQQPQQQQQHGHPKVMNYGSTDAQARVPTEGSSSAAAAPLQAGLEQGVPPSYEQAIKGDHKIQTGE
ncbi:MAG: hypothetical protein M1826_002257 [Phylliscum demangeonii]|nr:MAG: hypothetical protein M1826_002257 [Phylliscum demangeonii]